MLSGFRPACFLVPFCSVVHTLNYWTVYTQWFQFFNWGVIECNIARRRSVAVLWVLYKIRCNQRTPCGMGVRIQPTPALRRVVRGDYLRDMSYPLPPGHSCRVFLHAMGLMSWDSSALGCPGPGNILFLRWPTSCSWGLQNTLQECAGLSKNLSDVAVALSQCDLLLCSETLVSDWRHI